MECRQDDYIGVRYLAIDLGAIADIIDRPWHTLERQVCRSL
jgi:hypothetical protein